MITLLPISDMYSKHYLVNTYVVKDINVVNERVLGSVLNTLS